MGTGDFLSRWSRRKQETRLPPAEPPPAPEPVLEGDAAPAEAALSAEELAALPSLDAIDIGTDLTQFLRAGVPPLLRNAALRRMWSLDPAIRDYLCEAREYAFDWNVAGGVPGAGPLLPTDDVEAMLARIIGDRTEARPEAVAQVAEEAADVTAEARPPAEDPPPQIALETSPDPVVAPPAQTATEAAAEESRQSTASVTRVRRHGGAIPL
ncbi:DUF3306 domain-containing protein [Methylobacterium sp. A54F]